MAGAAWVRRSAKSAELTKANLDLLERAKALAEKTQSRTLDSISIKRFTSPEEVAELIFSLASGKFDFLNGTVVPGDGVKEPIKPLVTSVPKELSLPNLIGKSIVLSGKDTERLASIVTGLGAKTFILKQSDLVDQKSATAALKKITETHKPDAHIHLTVDLDVNTPLMEVSQHDWEGRNDEYIHRPAQVVKAAVEAMAPGSEEDPKLFKKSRGTIIIAGPAMQSANKLTAQKARRREVFLGAMRPFNTTVNHELGNVLGSDIGVYLLIPGSIDGVVPQPSRIYQAVVGLLGQANRTEREGGPTIFYVN